MLYEQKINIYKEIIQYLLDSTHYPIQKIATLANSPIAHLQSIYCLNQLPNNRNTELNLIKLFGTLIDMELKGEWRFRQH